MNKETGIAALQEIIQSGKETRSSIARALDIDASQVSRIASGNFRRMSGHALKVCKFALNIQAKEHMKIKSPELSHQLSILTARFVEKDPLAAQALAGVLHSLIENTD